MRDNIALLNFIILSVISGEENVKYDPPEDDKQYQDHATQRAKEYLISQGLDPDKVLEEGMKRIAELKKWINEIKAKTL